MTALLDHAGPAATGGARPERRDPARPGSGALLRPSRRADDPRTDSRASLRDVARAVAWALLAVALWQVWPQTVGGPMAYVRVSGTSMEPGLRTGDLVAVRRRDGYAVGDVVAYRVPDGELGARQVVIHRLVGGDGRTGWTTLGDNRRTVDPWRPTDRDVVGALVWTSAGRGDDVARLAQPVPLGLLCGGLTTLVLLWPDRRRRATATPTVPMVLDGLRLVPFLDERPPGRVVVRWGADAPAVRCGDVPGLVAPVAPAVPAQRPTPGRVVVVHGRRGAVQAVTV